VVGLASALALYPSMGCQSAPETKSSTAPSSPEVKTATSTSLLGAADRELRALYTEIDDTRRIYADVLFAVNRVLVRHPQCIDVWFDKAAKIDEDIERTYQDAEHLRKRLRIQHDALQAKQIARINLDRVTQLRNQIQLKRDGLDALRPRLASLIASAMNRKSPCPELAQLAENP